MGAGASRLYVARVSRSTKNDTILPPRFFPLPPSAILALALLFATSVPAAAQEPAKAASATTLSGYGDYAAEVTRECLNNRAYGLSTGGVPLKAFCSKLGNEAALKKRQLLQPAAPGALGLAAR